MAKAESSAPPSVAASFRNPDELIVYLLGVVDEWKTRDNRCYSIASVGQDRLRGGEGEDDTDTIAADLFDVLEDQLEAQTFPSELSDGLKRLSEFLAQRGQQ